TRLTRFRNSTPVMQLLYQLAVSSVILMPAAPLFGELVRDFTPMIGGIFAFQVLVVVGVGFLVWFWVLSIYPTSDMASFGFLTPLFGVSFGWLILSEQVSIALLGGLAMVSVGIVLINRKPKRVPG
ncbi:MAG: DMT family transporter, partial [Rhizobiales bacterium]|nr:DMT family transporter [Hyphomicrobiales bacterium]